MERSLKPNYMHADFDLGKNGGQVGAFNAPLDERPSNQRTLQTLCLSIGFCVSFFWFMCLVWRKVHAPALALVTKLIQVYHRFCMVSLFNFSLVLMTHGILLMFVEFWFCRCWEQFECFVGWEET